MAVANLGLYSLSVGAGMTLSGGTVSVSVANSVTIAGAGNGSVQLVNDSASPGANMFYGTNGAGVRGWLSDSSVYVTSLTGTAGQVLVGGTSGSPQTGALTLTLATALTSIDSITAESATNLVLNGGSSGASLTLGQGANGNVLLAPKGTGGVGIGTSGPQHLLQANYSDASTSFASQIPGAVAIQNTDTTNNNVALFSFKLAQANTVGAGVGLVNVNNTTGSTAAYGDLAFYTKPSGGSFILERGRFTSGGNFGIGTSSPNVTGIANVNSRVATVYGTDVGYLELATSFNGDGATAGGLIFASSANTSGKTLAAIYSTNRGSTALNNGGDLTFYTKADAGSLAERARITQTGNFLIGGTTDITGSGGLKVFGSTASTSTTTGAFQVVGGAGIGGSAYVGNGLFITSGSSAAGQIWFSSLTGMTIQGKTGSSYDAALATPAGTVSIAVSTGTSNIVIPNGTLTVGSGFTGVADDKLAQIDAGTGTDVRASLQLRGSRSAANGTAAGVYGYNYGGAASNLIGVLYFARGAGVNDGRLLLQTASAGTLNTVLTLDENKLTTLAGTLTVSGTGTSSFAGLLSVTAGAGISATSLAASKAIQFTGIFSGDYIAYIKNAQGTGTGYGLLVDAGSTSADVAFKVRNNVGSDLFYVKGIGDVVTTSTTTSTSTTTGALVVGSNVGLSGNAGGANYFGGAINSGAAASRAGQLTVFSPDTASAEGNVIGRTGGGMLINTNGNNWPIVLNGSSIVLQPAAGAAVSCPNTTDATTGGAGSLTTAGGFFAAKSLVVGGSCTIGSNTTNATSIIINGTAASDRVLKWQAAGTDKWQMYSKATTDALNIYNIGGTNTDVASFDHATGNATFSYSVAVNATTDSASLTTGSLVTSGGAAIPKNLITGQGRGYGVTSTATAGSTTTLTSASTMVQVFTGAASQTVTLPAANVFGAGVGAVYIIKNRSTASITISRAGTDLIDGAVTASIASMQSITVIADGVSNWEIV